MSAIADEFLSTNAKVDEASIQPFPGSRKIYITGSREDIRVPMREITLSDTQVENSVERNAPVLVYDTSGPYTDPQVQIDIREGLPELRKDWIFERGDTEQLNQLTSECS